MGCGITSYECVCGGIITEDWNNVSTIIECDKCDTPKAKALRGQEEYYANAHFGEDKFEF